MSSGSNCARQADESLPSARDVDTSLSFCRLLEEFWEQGTTVRLSELEIAQTAAALDRLATWLMEVPTGTAWPYTLRLMHSFIPTAQPEKAEHYTFLDPLAGIAPS